MIEFCRSVSTQIATRITSRCVLGRDFFAAASERIELCAPQVVEGPPSNILAGQLERVRASPFGVSHAAEIEAALGGPRFAHATSTYIFKDVTIAKSWMISDNRHEIVGWPKSEWAFSRPNYLEKAVLAHSIQGSRYFGHWLRDDCATSLMLPEDLTRISVSRERWADEKFYTDLLEIPPANIVLHGHVKELMYIDDLANNSHKLARFIRHRAALRKKRQSNKSHHIVYISRGPSARGRVIDNEADLIKALEVQGVKIVVSEGLSTSAFFDEIQDATLIISAEGSQCAHALYALHNSAAGLITLQPHDRFYLPHLEWTRLLGFGFGAVVSNPDHGDFWIDPAEVLRTVDLF